LRLYEGMFILDDARCAEDYTGTVEKVHAILKQRGAEIVDSRKWEERKLAYPVRRHHRGVYVLIHFNAPTDAIGGIERQLRLAGDIVVRDMIVVDEDGVTMGAEKEAAKAAAAAAPVAAAPAAAAPVAAAPVTAAPAAAAPVAAAAAAPAPAEKPAAAPPAAHKPEDPPEEEMDNEPGEDEDEPKDEAE